MEVLNLFRLTIVLCLPCVVFAATGGSVQHCGRVACIVVVALLILSGTSALQNDEASPHVERNRRPARGIFREMGPCCFKRACRMDEPSFWLLHRMLCQDLGGRVRPKKGSKKKHKNGAKNGIITSPTRLSTAL